MAFIDEVIQTMRTDDPSTVREGKRFEKFLKNALEKSPRNIRQRTIPTNLALERLA